MPISRLLLPSVTLCALAVALAVTGVRAQTDLDAGKTGPQLFAQDCAACHRSPQGLLKNISSFGLVGFLRQHYTSSSSSANSVAAYLQSVANARPPAEPKKGKGGEQQAKQSPGSRAAPAAEAPASHTPPAQARAHEPATDHPERVNRRPLRKQAPAETGSTPPPEPATAAAPPAAGASPAPPAAAPEPAQPAAVAAAPVEPGFAEPLP